MTSRSALLADDVVLCEGLTRGCAASPVNIGALGGAQQEARFRHGAHQAL